MRTLRYTEDTISLGSLGSTPRGAPSAHSSDPAHPCCKQHNILNYIVSTMANGPQAHHWDTWMTHPTPCTHCDAHQGWQALSKGQRGDILTLWATWSAMAQDPSGPIYKEAQADGACSKRMSSENHMAPSSRVKVGGRISQSHWCTAASKTKVNSSSAGVTYSNTLRAEEEMGLKSEARAARPNKGRIPGPQPEPQPRSALLPLATRGRPQPTTKLSPGTGSHFWGRNASPATWLFSQLDAGHHA